jgi:hypothetical protein
MKRTIVLSILLIAVLTAAGAQESQFSVSPVPRFWGATVFARYALEPPAADQVETSFIAGLSAAYETTGYFRVPDGSLFDDGDGGFTADNTNYNRFDLFWQFGIQQGILPRADSPDDQAVVFAFYRGRYDLPFRDDAQLYFSSGLPEVDAGLLGAVHAGLAYSNVVQDDVTRSMSGVHAELVLQWGPAFLHNQILGSGDFTRTTLSGRGFIPLYAVPTADGKNVFNSYLAIFGAVDWATGPDVPMAVRSSIGTRSERPGTGGSVRGVESGRFDATLKAVANVEVRANLPSIVIGKKLPVLLPGVLLYTDGGYYNDLDGFSPTADDDSGTLLTSGAGVYVDIVNVAEIIFYTNYVWDPSRVDGTHWYPFSLGFGFHY